MNLHSSIVERRFRYYCSVWGYCSSTEERRLQNPQNRAPRTMTGSRFNVSAVSLIRSLAWQALEDLISSETRIIMFKAPNGLAFAM